MGSKSLISLVFVVSIALYGALAIAAPGVYQTRTEFLQEALGTEKPDSDVVWMNAELRNVVTKVLGHPPAMLRMRYWYDASRTAWIIDEIGKEKPITLGIVVENQEIQSLKQENKRLQSQINQINKRLELLSMTVASK